MSVRTIEHGGTWWTEGADGIWRRWSHVFGDWEPIEGLPPGLGAPPEAPATGSWAPLTVREEPFSSQQARPRSILREYLGTFLRLTLPAVLIGLALPILFLVSVLFLFLSREALPPPDNVRAIVLFSGLAGALLAGAATAARRLDGRWPAAARHAVVAVLATVAVPAGWLATGSAWSGSSVSKATTLGVVLLLGMAVEAIHRAGALRSLRADAARRSLFAGPG